MKITNNYINPISYKARIVIVKKQNSDSIILKRNKHNKESVFSKLMTKIIKPYLKSVLKNPS